MTMIPRLVLSAALLVSLAGCNRPNLTDRPEPQPAAEAAAARRPAAYPVADARISMAATTKRDGNLILFQGQPTPEQIEAFAGDGGTGVINLRTEMEMAEKVAFDEPAVVRRAGLEYVTHPTGPEGMNISSVRAFGRTVASLNGPVLMHCASGGRASAMWAAHLIVNEGVRRKWRSSAGRRSACLIR